MFNAVSEITYLIRFTKYLKNNLIQNARFILDYEFFLEKKINVNDLKNV